MKIETIVNCFCKEGFQVCSEDQPMEELEDQPPALPEMINSESYLHIDMYMYVCSKTGKPAQYWGERKRENRDTHIHVTSGQSLPSSENAPNKYAAPQPRGKGVHFHSMFSNTHTI